MKADFAVRGLELHSLYAWDYDTVVAMLDYIKEHQMNTLVLHRNDWVDLIVYPGLYFGNEKRPYSSIFERYAEIFEKLYQYTPTRRSGPYQRRAFLKRVLEQARRRGIDVYIENKELYFPDIILEFYPQLVKEGHICASDPFWMEFTREKYLEFFEEFPEISGIITAPATGESRVSIKSNRCTCERCRGTTKEQWFDTLLRTMYDPIHQAGKRLIVRDFVFDPQAHREIAAVMEKLPGDVIISLKNTPHDYYPTFPENARIGNVGGHEQWIEFDAMGQYFGWGIGIADLTEDYRRRMKSAKEKGAGGVIFRLDWESLDGTAAYKTLNKINMYAGAALAWKLDTPCLEIYERYLSENGWLAADCSPQQRSRAVEWYRDISGRTWPIAAKTPFVNACVFSDSSLMPISYEHAFWLGEKKNALSVWDPAKKDALAPMERSVKEACREKQEALEEIRALEKLAEQKQPGIVPEKQAYLQQMLAVDRAYVELFQVVTYVLMYSRYVLETREDRNGPFYQLARENAQKYLDKLKYMEAALREFWATTDVKPHVAYTLLDPDRVACLYGDLAARLREEQ